MGKKEFTTSKSKMTVMMFSLEGDDATLQAGIRSISQAMAGFGKPVKLLSKPPTELPTPPNEDETEELEVENEAVEQNETVINNSRPSKPRSFKAPKIITLDLSSGTKPLKAFIESKNPGSTDTKRY